MPQKQCCIIMPEGDGFKGVYDLAIKPVLRENDITPLIPNPGGDLFVQSKSHIMEAHFIIVDISMETVLYQIGIAHILEKSLILIGQNKERLPLGLKNYDPIIYDPSDWSSARDLKKGIKEHIRSFNDDVWRVHSTESKSDENKKLRRRLKESIRAYEEREGEVKSLMAELDRIRSDHNGERQWYAGLHRAVQEKDKTIETISAQLAISQKRLDSEKETCEELRRNLEFSHMLKDDYDQLKEQLSRLRSDKSKISQFNTSLTARNEALILENKQLSDTNATLTNENRQLKSNLKDATSKSDAANKKMKKYHEKMVRTERENTHFKSRIKTLESQVYQLEEEKDDLDFDLALNLDGGISRLRSTPITVSKDKMKCVFDLDEDRNPKHYITNDFEDRGETVFDRSTGLLWQKSGSGKSMSFTQAKQYVERCIQEHFGGYSDWRLPTIPELLSLLNPEKQSNGLYIDPLFDDTQNWCISFDSISVGGAFLVGFLSGRVGWSGLNFGNGFVRMCRS